MNTTVLKIMGGDPGARAALTKYVTSGGEDGGSLCVGESSGCKPWKETEAGRERYERLGRLMKKHKEGA